MNLHHSIETAEPAQEFTPKQLEAQEAMQETGETAAEVSKETGENTPEYWEEKAAKELDENGDSDAYREYSEKAKELGTTMGNRDISFGSSMTKSEIESKIREQERKYNQHMDAATRMAKENAEGKVYNAKNLISDHKWEANQNAKRIQELKKELKNAPK